MSGHDNVQPDDPLGPPDDDAEDSGLVELLAGAMFIAFGALALFLGSGYKLGSALDMGPGYIPRLVAFALIGMGAVGVVRGVLARDWRWPALPLWPMLWVAAAIVSFALLVGRAGLFLACVVAVLLSALAAPNIRWREAPVVALVLAVFCTLLFGYALRLPLPVWPQ
jgi:hypothetical protein